jgi:hypothetical protein
MPFTTVACMTARMFAAGVWPLVVNVTRVFTTYAAKLVAVGSPKAI